MKLCNTFVNTSAHIYIIYIRHFRAIIVAITQVFCFVFKFKSTTVMYNAGLRCTKNLRLTTKVMNAITNYLMFYSML